MKGLIIELENTPEGSRELDGQIGAAIKIDVQDPPAWVANWNGVFGSGRGVNGSKDGDVFALHPNGERGHVWRAPHFTTSLDAKVPGENITLVRFDRATETWTAWHENGDIILCGEGHTEPLARRIAGLKGMDAATKEGKHHER